MLVLGRGQRVSGSLRHHQDGVVAQILIPAAHFQHVAREGVHLRVIDGDDAAAGILDALRHARAIRVIDGIERHHGNAAADMHEHVGVIDGRAALVAGGKHLQVIAELARPFSGDFVVGPR